MQSASAIGVDDSRLAQGLVTDAEVRMATLTAHLLDAEYPGWAWRVEARPDQGVINIRNADLHAQWGYRVKLGQADTPAGWRHAIVMAGGELLERFGAPRGARTESAVAGLKASSAVIAEAMAEGRR